MCSRRTGSAPLRRRPVAAGLAYGVLLWLIMYWVVKPLRWPDAPLPHTAYGIANALFSHCILVGLPIGLIAARTSGPRLTKKDARTKCRTGAGIHSKRRYAWQVLEPLPGIVMSTLEGPPVIFQPPSAVSGLPASSAVRRVDAPVCSVRTIAILSPSKKVT